MSKGPQESQPVHFAKEFVKMPSDRNMLKKMSRQIPSKIPSDDEEVVVNWISGVVKTNVADARDSSARNVVRNDKETERDKLQANNILGKHFNPPKVYLPETPQRVYAQRTKAERLPESTKSEQLPESTKAEQLPESNNMDSGTRP